MGSFSFQLLQFLLSVYGILLDILQGVGGDIVVLGEEDLAHLVHVAGAPELLACLVLSQSVAVDVLHAPDDILGHLATLDCLLEGLLFLFLPHGDEGGKVTLVFRVRKGVTEKVFLLKFRYSGK